MALILPVHRPGGKRPDRRVRRDGARYPDGRRGRRGGEAMTNPQQPSEWSDPNWQPETPWSGSSPPPGPASGDTAHMPPYPPPAATPPGYPAAYPGGAYPYGQPMVVNAPMNGLAIASMIISILGFGPIGAIMGHIARKQIRETGEQGDGFALAGIIVGWVYTGIFALICCGWLVLVGMVGGSGGFN
jgi:hypothetical protein